MNLLTELCIAIAAMADLPTARSIEERAMAARTAIERGTYDLEIETLRPGHEKNIRSYHVVFDAEKRRFDIASSVKTMINGLAGGAIASHGGDSVERIILTNDEYIFYSPNKFENGKRVSAMKGPRHAAGPIEKRNFDPLALGMGPMPFMLIGTMQRDSFVLSGKRSDEAIEQVDIGGETCWRITYNRNERTIIRLWSSPVHGYSVVRAEMEQEQSSGAQLKDVATSVNHEVSVGRLWFPSLLSWRRTRDSTLVFEENVKVSNVQFNLPIDGKVFTLEGVEIEPGTRVVDVPRAPGVRAKEWDGEKLVDVERKQLESSTALPESRRRRVLIIVGANCLAIAAALLWLCLRKRRATL